MQLNIRMQKSSRDRLLCADLSHWPVGKPCSLIQQRMTAGQIHPDLNPPRGPVLISSDSPIAVVDTELKWGCHVTDCVLSLWSIAVRSLSVVVEDRNLHTGISPLTFLSLQNCSHGSRHTIYKYGMTTALLDREQEAECFASTGTPENSTSSTARPHACQFPGCGKSFRRRFTMIEHVKTHSGEKAFTCPVRSCRKSFTTSGNLSRHKRAQHAWLDAPLECLVNGCGCKFSSEAKLERHMVMVHFGASSHSCPVKHCGRAFTTAGNLRRHTKQHHIHGKQQKEGKERVTVLSPSAVSELTQMEPITVARWSSHCLLDSQTVGSSNALDDDFLAVLAYFLDE